MDMDRDRDKVNLYVNTLSDISSLSLFSWTEIEADTKFIFM